MCRALRAALRASAFAWSEVKPWEVCELRRDRASLAVNRTFSLRGGKERYAVRVGAKWGAQGGSHSRGSGEGGTVVANGGSIRIRWWPGRKVGGQNPWCV